MPARIPDRLKSMLENQDTLYGIICRDATNIDIELLAQAGYHVIWMDHEHSAQSLSEMLRLSRTIHHLGMVPMLRVSELSRTQIQAALDGGIHILTLPNVENPHQVQQFVRYGKYPPAGERGVSTTNAGADYSLGEDIQQTLQEVNDATHLMIMIESENGFNRLDEILAVDGIDMVTIGPLDWASKMEVYGSAAQQVLRPRIEEVIRSSSQTGKIVAMVALSDADLTRQYHHLGVRIFFIGEDIVMKREKYADTLRENRSVLRQAWQVLEEGKRLE